MRIHPSLLWTWNRTIDRGPYVALQYFPMARKCLGGVRTDLDCRVRGADGSPISGLYAAGEIAGMAPKTLFPAVISTRSDPSSLIEMTSVLCVSAEPCVKITSSPNTDG